MELKKISEHYIQKDSASEAVYFVMEKFTLENKEELFGDEFVFDELLEDHLKNNLKNKMTFDINEQKYFALNNYIFTYERMNKILYRVLILSN